MAHGTLATKSGVRLPFLATQRLVGTQPLLEATCNLPVSLQEATQLVTAAWSSLKAVHDLGVVHGSIHDGNLLLGYTPGPGAKCMVWLIDFQRARMTPPPRAERSTISKGSANVEILPIGWDGYSMSADCRKLDGMLQEIVGYSSCYHAFTSYRMISKAIRDPPFAEMQTHQHGSHSVGSHQAAVGSDSDAAVSDVSDAVLLAEQRQCTLQPEGGNDDADG
jgi:hypothetical protein